jgi:glycosyltransferase involved in cell wall biosynthesis
MKKSAGSTKHLRRTENKRILFFVSSMHGGGAERVASLLCNHWASQEYDVNLVATFSGGGECVYLLDNRVRFDYLSDFVGGTSKSIFNKIRRLFALRRIIRDGHADVVVSFLTHVNVAVLLASRGLGVPVVVSERTFPPAMPLGATLERLRRLTYHWASKVVVQTQEAEEWLRAWSRKAEGRVIPNPVVFPLPSYKPAIAPIDVVNSGQRLILAVGRLGVEKGFDTLLEAFSELAEKFRSWDLVILGEGSERPALERLRARLELAERVHIPGRVGNLVDWYERSDGFVLSSQFEGFPNALLEAMAHGLPAVSFDCHAGPRDIIRHGVDGILVPRQHGVTGLVSALESLMTDELLREKLGSAARNVRERFSSDRVMAQWDRVLGFTE